MKKNVPSATSMLEDALKAKKAMDKVIVGREAWEQRPTNPLEEDFEGKHLDPDELAFGRVVANNPNIIHDKEAPF